ncbi:MAG: hypothetical protein ABIP78_01800 [Pyrinomonadaceae bacterium]
MKEAVMSSAVRTVVFGLLALSVNAQDKPIKIVLQVKYVEDRFFVEPVLESGKSILLFTDTGGGLFIYKDVAERLKLDLTTEGENQTTELNKFKAGSSIPQPLGSSGKIYIFPKQTGQMPTGFYDGMLGQQWFADRIWTFDYPKKQLSLWSSTPKIIEKKSAHRITLGFQTNTNGKRQLNFPRIQVEIDGETLEMLFDTGATTFLTKDARETLKRRWGVRAGYRVYN